MTGRDFPLLIVCVTVTLGGLAAVSVLRAVRRRAYRRCPASLRWPFFAFAAALASLGAAGLVDTYARKRGVLTAA